VLTKCAIPVEIVHQIFGYRRWLRRFPLAGALECRCQARPPCSLRFPTFPANGYCPFIIIALILLVMNEIFSFLIKPLSWIYSAVLNEPGAFQLKYTEPSFNIPMEQQVERELLSILELPIGKHLIQFQLIPRFGASFTKVNFRFVASGPYKIWKHIDASKDIVEVLSAEPYDKMIMIEVTRDHAFEEERELANKPKPYFNADTILLANQFYRGERWFSRRQDNVGGSYILFDPPYRRQPNEPFMFACLIVAKKPWKGFVSLQMYRESNKPRVYRRLPIRFIPQPTPETEGS